MEALIAILAFLIILVVLVIVHELGHFLTAKASGVQVLEFGIGFPPRIWGIKRERNSLFHQCSASGRFRKTGRRRGPENRTEPGQQRLRHTNTGTVRRVFDEPDTADNFVCGSIYDTPYCL
jgi:hypothetical protein